MNFIIVILILLRNIPEFGAFEESEKDYKCAHEDPVVCEPMRTDEQDENADYSIIYKEIGKAENEYIPCVDKLEDPNCNCYADIIQKDLLAYRKDGISLQMIANASRYGTRYKVLNHRLYRDADCMFPARCSGIEYFLLNLLLELPDMDLVVNTRDWPQLRASFVGLKGPVFSFSKTNDYSDIMYPAWTFWAGGPAISLHPTGIGRWDLLRTSIDKESGKTPWSSKISLAFFRGSRTSDERDSLVLLSRRNSDLVDAQYTKNQAWKSPKDTLNAEPAKEVSFEEHCQYKYLFNFRGVAASFRLKHLFLCNSLVFHVGNEWNEFFYPALKPWIHYVPVKSYPSQQELESILNFFRNNDELAEKIAKQGRDFIWSHLRMQDVECYWKKLLLQYQMLLKYKVVKNTELIEIKSKIRQEL